MLRNRGKDKQKAMVITALALGAIVVLLGIFFSGQPKPGKETGVIQTKTAPDTGEAGDEGGTPEQSTVVTGKIQKTAPIDYKEIQKEGSQKALMEERKKNLGFEKSLDMIVKSDESFIVGDSKVSMQEILEKAFTAEKKVFQEEITETDTARPVKIKEYGIYVVQPGDNIWNIHFSMLKEYYASRGVPVGSDADQPNKEGFSSGVGKILKFSETMVIIYNLVEEKVTKDINLLEPLSKVIVYNMDEVFSLLEEINFENVNRIQFDGKSIWIPTKNPDVSPIF